MNQKIKKACCILWALPLFLVMGCSLFQSGNTKPDKKNVTVEKDLPSQARTTSEPRRRILVLPFLSQLQSDSQSKNTDILDQGRRSLIRQLIATEGIVVVDVTDLPKDLTDLRKGDGYDLAAVAQSANQFGVSAVLEGQLLEVKAQRLGDQVGLFRKVQASHTATVRIRMASSKTGKDLLNETRTGTVEASTTLVASKAQGDQALAYDPQLVKESVAKALKGLVVPIFQALKKTSWEGRIALVNAEKIYVNAGRASGLQIGDILRVREVSENVYDPENGELIGAPPGRTKGTLEVVSYFGKDGAVAVVHSGSGFQANDLVELY